MHTKGVHAFPRGTEELKRQHGGSTANPAEKQDTNHTEFGSYTSLQHTARSSRATMATTGVVTRTPAAVMEERHRPPDPLNRGAASAPRHTLDAFPAKRIYCSAA